MVVILVEIISPPLSICIHDADSPVGKEAEACFLIFFPPPLFSQEAGIKLSRQRSRGLFPHLPSPPFPLTPGSRERGWLM